MGVGVSRVLGFEVSGSWGFVVDVFGLWAVKGVRLKQKPCAAGKMSSVRVGKSTRTASRDAGLKRVVATSQTLQTLNPKS